MELVLPVRILFITLRPVNYPTLSTPFLKTFCLILSLRILYFVTLFGHVYAPKRRLIDLIDWLLD